MSAPLPAPSPPRPRRPALLACAEAAALLAAAGAVVALHVVNYRRAGPLWRDEVGDAVYAALPTWGRIWANLPYDNFPPGLLAGMRAWRGLGLAPTDAGFRAAGLLVGLAVVAALFANARLLGARWPWFSLGLFAASGQVVRVGDSIRPYGLGWLFILCSLGLTWRVARTARPGWRETAPAAAAAVLAVQCLYQDAFFLLAAGAAAMIVAGRAGRWRAAAAVAAIGVLAAVSLLPYALGPVRAAGAWSVVSRPGVTWERMGRVAAAGSPGSLPLFAWLLVAGGLAAAGCRWGKDDPAAREARLYAGLAAGLGLPLYAVFLKTLGMVTFTWYYLLPLAVAAVALDAAGGALSRSAAGRWARVAFLAAATALAARDAWPGVNARATNADLAAARLAGLAGSADLVVVNPWWYGVSFQYYYRGTAAWETLPPLADHTIHRFDLMRQAMRSPAGIQPLLERMEATLRAGHRVWLAGETLAAPPDARPVPAPRPAPDPRLGWSNGGYALVWAVQTRQFLEAHDGRIFRVPGEGPEGINGSDYWQLYGVEGWRP